MTRKTPEWIGKTDDTAIPKRVMLRLFERACGKCQCCTRKITTGERWDADHKIALVNGGENREANLQVLCQNCHKAKTKTDVAIKSKTARVRAKHLGLSKSRNPMPGSKASRWKKRMNGTVERRKC